jgi:hypothetical protein
MIFLTVPAHGCVYTLSQEDGDELYFSPILADGSVNLEEFAPVEFVDELDEETMQEIRNRLQKLMEV